MVWDKKALHLALELGDDHAKAALSSLYLNVAKCHEDMGDLSLALEIYRLAEASSEYLNADGYGDMIHSAIQNGIKRVSN